MDLEQHGRSGVGAEIAALPHVELVAQAEVPVADVTRRPVPPPHAHLGRTSCRLVSAASGRGENGSPTRLR